MVMENTAVMTWHTQREEIARLNERLKGVARDHDALKAKYK